MQSDNKANQVIFLRIKPELKRPIAVAAAKILVIWTDNDKGNFIISLLKVGSQEVIPCSIKTDKKADIKNI